MLSKTLQDSNVEEKVSPLEFSEGIAHHYAEVTSQDKKREKGQFFTSSPIARFMANQASFNGKPNVRILDPGAGTGILSIAIIEKLVQTNPDIQRIDLVLYEIDLEIINSLTEVIENLKLWVNSEGVSLNYEIISRDFILENSLSLTFGSGKSDKFDYIISNPPYFKVSKDDSRAKAAESIVHGQPNIYSMFLAVSAELLTEFGELIFITPRSFASGTYFRKFREFFFDRITLNSVHSFDTRDKAFKKDNVLQETIIFKGTKYPYRADSNNLEITTSNGIDDLSTFSKRTIPLKKVLDLDSYHKILYLPQSEDDERLIELFEGWKYNFKTMGIQISTGPVVAFRSLDFLSKKSNSKTVPLIWLNHVKLMNLEWPLYSFKKEEHVDNTNESKSILLPNKNYVLLRRFSAKGDSSRLISCPYYASDHAFEKVGIENKLNYIYRPKGELTEKEAAGISALLSSELFDNYFRVFNGNTQVSATELRLMKFPPIEIITEIGEEVLNLPQKDKETISQIVSKFLLGQSKKIIRMSKIEEAQEILKALGLKSAQQNEISAFTLLALCGVKEGDKWNTATRSSLGVTKGIMAFISEEYGRDYAPNTRETVRRQVLHQFVEEGVALYNPDNPKLPVNSPRAHYSISNSALSVIQTYGTKKWKSALSKYQEEIQMLRKQYQKKRSKKKIPLTLANGKIVKLSPGKHNEVQAAIVEQFAQRFAPGAKLLYLGDTEKKDLIIERKTLNDIGIPIGKHTKLPDIIIYDEKKKWLYLIEAVTSHGPISDTRVKQLIKLTEKCEAGNIYVTAFPDFKEFKKHATNIAWDTEVWLADMPEHMIHFNGDRFLGPR